MLTLSPIAQKVVQSILERKIRPGDRLGEQDLADLFGVSRVSVEPGDTIDVRVIDLRSEPRCERSWKRDATVRMRAAANGLPATTLSDRDADAVGMT